MGKEFCCAKHGNNLGSCHVKKSRRGFTQVERTHRIGIRVTLPQNIDGGDREIHRFTFENLASYIDQYAVTKIDRIVEPEDEARRFKFLGIKLKDPLASETGLRILTDRI